MRVFRRSKFQRHLVVLLMLTCFLSGCYKWTPATARGRPEHARLTLDDGRVVELRSLEMRGDSVAGFAKEGQETVKRDTAALRGRDQERGS